MPARTCKGCGCDLQERTTGCHACGNRHWTRSMRAKAKGRTYTPEQLSHRAQFLWAYMRRNPGALNPIDALAGIVWPSDEFAEKFIGRPIPYARTKERCKGCGCGLDTATEDCKVCWDRHYRRRSRREAVAA